MWCPALPREYVIAGQLRVIEDRHDPQAGVLSVRVRHGQCFADPPPVFAGDVRGHRDGARAQIGEGATTDAEVEQTADSRRIDDPPLLAVSGDVGAARADAVDSGDAGHPASGGGQLWGEAP